MNTFAGNHQTEQPEILFHFEDVLIPDFDQSVERLWIKRVIKLEGDTPGELNFVFCTDSYLLEINKQYLGHEDLTDIITFDYTSGGSVISGDIFISYDRILENAVVHEQTAFKELRRVMVHGILHLSGYGDATDDEKELMRSKENYYLSLRARI